MYNFRSPHYRYLSTAYIVFTLFSHHPLKIRISKSVFWLRPSLLNTSSFPLITRPLSHYLLSSHPQPYPTLAALHKMSTPGLGVNLRVAVKKDGSKLLDGSLANQTAVVNVPFDPVEDHDCVGLELFGTWCQPCIRFIPTLMKLSLTYKNIKILQIAQESPDKLKQFFKGVKVPYPVSAVTPEFWEELSNIIQLRGIPHFVLIRDGVIIFSGHPMEPTLEPLLKKVNAELEQIKKDKKAAQEAAPAAAVEVVVEASAE